MQTPSGSGAPRGTVWKYSQQGQNGLKLHLSSSILYEHRNIHFFLFPSPGWWEKSPYFLNEWKKDHLELKMSLQCKAKKTRFYHVYFQCKSSLPVKFLGNFIMWESPNTKALKNKLTPWLSRGHSLWQDQYFLFSAPSSSLHDTWTMLRNKLPPQCTPLRGLKPWAQGPRVGGLCCQHLVVGQGLGSHTGCSQTANNLRHELDLGWFLERKNLSRLVTVFGFCSNVSSLVVDMFRRALIN